MGGGGGGAENGNIATRPNEKHMVQFLPEYADCYHSVVYVSDTCTTAILIILVKWMHKYANLEHNLVMCTHTLCVCIRKHGLYYLLGVHATIDSEVLIQYRLKYFACMTNKHHYQFVNMCKDKTIHPVTNSNWFINIRLASLK